MRASSLRAWTAAGGLGFCYEASPDLFSGRVGCGPLLVALDSNLVIDLQQHGEALFEGQPVDVDHGSYREELEALGQLLDLWLLRDIRLIAPSRASTDAKRNTSSSKVARRLLSLQRLEETLHVQLDELPDAGDPEGGPAHDANPRENADLERLLRLLPGGADRDLVQEAVELELDVFLTRDRGVARQDRRFRTTGLRLMRPTELLAHLERAGVGHLGGGLRAHEACPYDPLPPAGDMGKWNALLQILCDGSA